MTTLSGPERPDLLKDERLHDIFLLTATHYPNKVALRWQDEEITYRQLHQQALQMALALRETKHIGPGSIVGIQLTHSAKLHVTIIAVLMTGATYAPFDADTPQERVSAVLADLQAVLLLVDSLISVNHPLALDIQTLSGDKVIAGDGNLSVHINANSAAYIICTSGSTGKPKAIAVSHRNICHLVRADNEIMQIRHEDIVYQGSSAAFDMFFEETFLAYLVGATLVIASASDVLNIDQLHLFFIHHSITVLFCVPTLLLLMKNDPALKLRLINTGGEACPQTLVDRWWKEERLLFNSYGPTETIVSATAILLHPGEPISIGVPLPNYVCCLLDETTGQPTSANTGELCIRGPGVALGYVGRESLTREKFTKYGYRTGDRVTFDKGKIFFHERIDSQVKLRGFRIELDEIEQELLRLGDEVQSAAVAVLHEQLVAFIVGKLTESHMRETLGQRLPHYMVPDRLIKLDGAMPRLVSGKIDRKALAALFSKEDAEKMAASEAIIDMDEHKSIAESVGHNTLDIVLDAFQTSTSHVHPNKNDDFFLDLGGHSLTAALTITKLRKFFPGIALHDLYECKTAAKLAELLMAKYNNNVETIPVSATILIKPTWTRSLLCSTVQALVIVVLAGVASFELLLPYIVFVLLLDHGGIGYSCLAAYGIFVAVPPFRCLLAIVVKWIVIGRFKEGDFPLWGTMYLRWWTVDQFQRLAASESLSDTPLMASYYRLLGAKIGRNVHLSGINCWAADLLEIGDGTTISSDVCMQTGFVDDYTLKFRRVCIQRDVYIGGRCVIGGQTKMEDHSELDDMSFLPSGTCVPSEEVWHGSPATYSHRASLIDAAKDPSSNFDNASTPIFMSIVFGAIILLFLPFLYFVPMVPGLILFEYVEVSSISDWVQIIVFSPVVGILYTCFVVLEIILVHLLLVSNITVGVYSTKSWTYIRKWIFDLLSYLALHVIHTFYATLYITPFLRALGMKIGHRCEVSTAIGMVHSLVEIDDESFIADDVTLADPYIRRGQMHLQKTIIGKRVFIGNSAVIADGAQIPNKCLIGCISVVADGLKEGQSCFGSPAFIAPRRAEAPGNFSEELTYRPRAILIFGRLCIDTIRIMFPRIVVVFEIGIAVQIFKIYSKLIGFGLSFLTLPILYITIFALPSLVICIALKWLVMGTYKNNHYAMWSWFVWTSEFVTATYEQLAVGLLLEFLQGTFFLAPALRCFGVKIGRGCFLDTTDMTEFDLVHIGDYVVLNTAVGLQTHLFEDRIMKVAEVCLEDETTIGCASIMLPNTRLGQGAKLGPLSLVIKGEGIPAKSSWQGIPIRAYEHTDEPCRL